MNIIIPLGGLGNRFREQGFNVPKPLIKVFFKPIIFWLLDNLNFKTGDNVYILCNPELRDYRFEDEVRKKYSNVTIINLQSNTNGAAESVLRGIADIDNKSPCILLDGDTFYTIDILSMYRTNCMKNAVFCFEQTDTNPIYSYIKFNEKNIIKTIVEKQRISSFANTGAYAFSSMELLKKYCKKVVDSSLKSNNELYMSCVISEMISDGLEFEAVVLDEKDFNVVGTPVQYKIFQQKFLSGDNLSYFKDIRVCFDLDNTLVTYPKTCDDYTTVEPIYENISFLKFIKKLGCYVIIHTARRMRTHAGNVGKIMQDVGEVTLQTLRDFEIPYDEIVFGKPHAHAYIDDLAVNVFHDYRKELGVDNYAVNSREFNKIKVDSVDTIVKTSNNKQKIQAEIEWYNNISGGLREFTPALINCSGDYSAYTLEKISGITFHEMYVDNMLSVNDFNRLIDIIEKFHTAPIPVIDKSIDIYGNYVDKMKTRYNNYNYKRFSNSDKVYSIITDKLLQYAKENRGNLGIIHGDPVFTNILRTEAGNIKLIDPRGEINGKFTIYGDVMYDYAKIYQSLIGYDEILSNKTVCVERNKQFKKILLDIIAAKYGKKYTEWLKVITQSLLFTLIPLHDDILCEQYFDLINKIDNE